ncbi:MAG: hypothetical protein NZ903_02300, partial [Candidatus Micrarchaeota archaeon]|nr:hypothetical protein [Candidatus Micrarchaeota archaeon]
MLLRFGVRSNYLRNNDSFILYSNGIKNLSIFATMIGFVSDSKQKKLLNVIKKSSLQESSSWDRYDVVPNCGNVLLRIMKRLKLTRKEVFGSIDFKPDKPIPRSLFAKALSKFRERLEEIRDLYYSMERLSIKELKELRKRYGISQRDIGQMALNVSYLERNEKMESRYKALFKEYCESLLSVEHSLRRLEDLINSEIQFVRVEDVQIIENEGVEWVYDVGVRPTEAFVSECAILHNSVSVAKAGIVAKFKARTSILAAANPKFGRFDPNQLIAIQFDIPPTLQSRFDLIFPIRDVIDETSDRRLAKHILETHKNAAEKIVPESKEERVDTEFLRKYIAYARKNIKPKLSPEAQNRIESFYVQLREMGKKQGAVPITPRQIEGIIRLSEASAKARLSEVVELRDAELAISLMEYVLREIALDRSTGTINIDMITTGQPRSKQQQYYDLYGAMRELSKHFDPIPKEKIYEEGINNLKLDERTVRMILDEMLKKGEIFEPKPGFYKLVHTFD